MAREASARQLLQKPKANPHYMENGVVMSRRTKRPLARQPGKKKRAALMAKKTTASKKSTDGNNNAKKKRVWKPGSKLRVVTLIVTLLTIIAVSLREIRRY